MTDKPTLQQQWVEEKAVFTAGQLKIKGLAVMEAWETDYMEKLASIASSNGGTVLEIGFGLGISAGFIQDSPKVDKHIVIEPHPDVIAFAHQKFPQALDSGRMQILEGFWESTSHSFSDGTFDGILFDTIPLDVSEWYARIEAEFFQEAYRLLKSRGIFTYFCSFNDKQLFEPDKKLLQQIGFSEIGFELVSVNPATYNEYWPHKTMVAPMIRK